MALYAVDTLIKTMRTEHGLTQAQLAEGICSRKTIYRIERGEHMPDWYTFSLIMRRLAVDPIKYYNAIATKDDLRMGTIVEEIKSYASKGQYDIMGARIKELENDPLFENDIYRAQYLHFKSAYLNIKNHSEAAHQTLLEAFHVMRPDFDPNKLDTYILTFDEIHYLNTLAIINKKLYGLEKGTEILKRARANIEKGYIDEQSKKTIYITVLFNIAKNACDMKQYEDCLEACETGLPLALYYNDISLYVKFLPMKGYCLLSMGKQEEGMSYCKRACHLFIGFGMKEQLAGFQTDIQRVFGIEIPVDSE